MHVFTIQSADAELVGVNPFCALLAQKLTENGEPRPTLPIQVSPERKNHPAGVSGQMMPSFRLLLGKRLSTQYNEHLTRIVELRPAHRLTSNAGDANMFWPQNILKLLS